MPLKFSLSLLQLLWICVVSILLPSRLAAEIPPDFKRAAFHEQTAIFTNAPGVRILINAPENFDSRRPLKLIFYTLPNGNNIEQTVGKKIESGDDWHFDIQHIGAQIRFLRQQITNEQIVVAYLENNLKSWPAWRKKFGDKEIPNIIRAVQKSLGNPHCKIVLTGHSGGGSFTFGYLNCVEKIPDEIERIAFLDSNYAYETVLHRDKIVGWLKSSPEHFLVVLAYHDDIALLNGKTFVSAAGGTWGKSHLMKKDLENVIPFSEKISAEWENYSALNGRIKFFLKENPERKILHTVQVERNGLIHALLCGTAAENKNYRYFGERAYSNLIAPE